MATAYHTPLQPSGVALSSVTRSFITTFGMEDRSYLGELDEQYGRQSYIWLLESIGNKSKVTNQTFYHWEERGKLHHAIEVVGPHAPAAGADITVTLAAGSHLNSGAWSPVRVGEILENATTGTQAKVTAVNKTVAGAHTATLEPLRNADTLTTAAGAFFVFRGMTDVGEASDVVDSLVNPARKVTNTVTEIREDYRITDLAAMEQVEFSVDGKQYYSYKGTRDAERRFLNTQEDKLMFGLNIDNTVITANGTAGSLGLIPQIKSRGGQIASAAGTYDITRFQEICRQLDYNGSTAEVQVLSDTIQFQEIQNELFSTYDQGAILWDSVGGSKEAAAKYGFQGLQIEGRNFHFKKYLAFNTESKYGVSPTTSYYRTFGVVLPMGKVRDKESGNMAPILEVCYLEMPGIGEYDIYDHGGLARSNKTGKRELVNTFITHKGLRLRGANQCLIVGANV
jgi:hypothetical protein